MFVLSVLGRRRWLHSKGLIEVSCFRHLEAFFHTVMRLCDAPRECLSDDIVGLRGSSLRRLLHKALCFQTTEVLSEFMAGASSGCHGSQGILGTKKCAVASVVQTL